MGILFETVSALSPFTDLILICTSVSHSTYSHFVLLGRLLQLQHLVGIVVGVVGGLVDASDRHSVVDTCLVNCRGQRVLRELQLCRLNQRQRGAFFLIARGVQQFPDLLGPRGARL